MPEPLVICDNLVKIYKVADLEVVALQGLDFEVIPGEMMAIVGVSGSGKTTLLNILSSLDVPSAGKCVVDGNDLTRLSQAQRIRYERFTVGHVWQQRGRNLLPELSIQDNIELPQVLGGVNSTRRASRAQELLELVGLGGMGKKRPDQREKLAYDALKCVGLAKRAQHRGLELSGAEQQRVALARALVHSPRFIVADEPTGNLDSVTGRDIALLLRETAQQSQIGLLVATHDATIVEAADRVLSIQDGRIIDR